MARRRQKPHYEVTIQVFEDAAPDLEAAARTLGVTPEDFLTFAPNFLLAFCEHTPKWTRNTFQLVKECYEVREEAPLQGGKSP